MAAAEARAAWQRTANRCFVHEDAKRAPKLTYSSSLISSAKPEETAPANATMHDIPTSNNQIPSHPNLSPNSRWWLQLQPNYKCQMDLMEVNSQSCEDVESSFDNIYQNFIANDEKLGCQEQILDSFEVLKKSDDISFDSGSSWVEKNTPWWRTADTDELALAVSRRSHDLLENCDLPMPQNKKNLKSNYEMMTKIPVRKTDLGGNHSLLSPKHGVLCEDQLSSPNKALSNRQSQKMHASDEETCKARLLEAIHHSQTRAREAEAAAKQACADKEHVVKLLFVQASELFAYKQLLQLLQMENMYLQFRTRKKQSASSLFSESRCATPKRWKKQPRRKSGRRGHPHYDVGRYAIVFALGLGIIGAGLLFGWMLPIW